MLADVVLAIMQLEVGFSGGSCGSEALNRGAHFLAQRWLLKLEDVIERNQYREDPHVGQDNETRQFKLCADKCDKCRL